MIIKAQGGFTKSNEVKEVINKQPENKNKKKNNKQVKEFIEEDVQKTFKVEDYLAD